MATMRVRHTTYYSGGSNVSNIDWFSVARDPEDAVNADYCTRIYNAGSSSSGTNFSLGGFPVLTIDNISSITLKAKIAYSGNISGTYGRQPSIVLYTLDGQPLHTYDISVTNPTTYMNSTSYSSFTIPSTVWNSVISGDYYFRIEGARPANGAANTYCSAAVLDIEYTPEDHITIGTSKLKKATLGSQNLKKIFNGTIKLFHYKRLPKEYEELEYIQNLPFPQNYIDTGVAWSGSTRIVGEFSTPATGSNGTKLFVATQGDSSMPGFTYLYIDTSNQMVGSNVTVGSYTIGTNTVDVTYQTSTTSNIYITAWSDVYWACTFRYKNFKIYNGNTLLRNYIPCYRKSDGVGGLYDLVNGVFYSSNGSSAYLKGPEVEIELPAAYQQVESITAHGDAYFDTSYTCGTGTSCRIDYLDDNSEGSVWANYFYTPFYRFIRFSGLSYGALEYRYSGTSIGYTYLPESTYNTRHVFEFTKQQILDENGSVLATHGQTTTDSWSTDKHLILFRGYYFNDWDVYGCYTLYNFRVYENNVLTRNYIPCYRKSDNKIGLYDTVVGAFITSTGTGTLTKGNNIY